MTIRLSTGLRNQLLDTGSMKATFANAKLEYFTGAQPASPDDAATGALLVTIDNTTGINFGTAAAGVLPKDPAEVWTGVAGAAGTAGYFRLSALADANGASTAAARIDGSVGTFGADLNLSSTTVAAGATQTVDAFDVTLPAA